jgi:hypothetical protein
MEPVEQINDEIAVALQRYDLFFRNFWDLGGVRLLNDEEAKANGLETAAIQFDKTGGAVSFLFNQKFWNKLDTVSRSFVLCHEMLHVVFQHGVRFLKSFGTVKDEAVAKATDVVINELLVSKFGFNRSALDPFIKNECCWLDTVFSPKDGAEPNKCADYYINLIEKTKKSGGKVLDSHYFFSSGPNDDPAGNVGNMDEILCGVSEEFLKKVNDALSPEDKEILGEMMQQAGNGAGGQIFFLKAPKKIKKKWETVINKWSRMAVKDVFRSQERWDMRARRHHLLDMDGLFLPSEVEFFDIGHEEDRIGVFFFLDTSGSCIDLKERFFKAAKSLDPKKFDLRVFCFDTIVYETSLASGKIYGGGGTRFDIIEDKIQEILKKEGKKYPKAVWIITDGYGSNVFPQNPKNWYWFLTANWTGNIPKESKTYNLSDYE